MEHSTRTTPPLASSRRLKALFSLEVFPFAVLLALSLTSILCRAWLMVRAFLAAHLGI